MAGIVDSNRDLWQFLTGTSLPLPLITAELERSKTKLTSILHFYKKQSANSAESVRKDKSLSSLQQEFILKLSACLELDEVQCSDLYCTFLLRDYRGSKKDLQDVLNSDRHRRALIQRVRDYYVSERLYLLRCLKHLFSFWEEDQHPYYSAFNAFVKDLYEKDDFIKTVTEQFVEISQLSAPVWTTAGNLLMERSGADWLVCNLREQCELLELMLLYRKAGEHKLDDLLLLLEHFKKYGYGRCQVNRHLVNEVCEPVLQRIGFLEVLLVIEAMEVEQLVGMADTESKSAEGILESTKFVQLNKIFSSLGDTIEHGPLLLMWAALCQINADIGGESASSKTAQILGKQALKLRAFDYLAANLSMEPFSGKSVVASISHSIVYGLLCLILDQFHEDTLGADIQNLHLAASHMLQRQFIALDFWARGFDDGIGMLLQSALCEFPLEFSAPMRLLIALAKSGQDSSREVVKLLQRLTQFTEHLDRSTDVRATADCQATLTLLADRVPYREVGTFVIPRGSRGRFHKLFGSDHDGISQWAVRYDGWNVLLGEVHLLLSQVSLGADMIQNRHIHNVTQVCQLLSAILAVDAEYVLETVTQIEPLIDALYHIINRFCMVSPAPIDLLTSCLDVLRHMVQFQPQKVWHNLQQTGMLPFLTGSVTDIASKPVNSGAYGALLAGHECIMGKYPLTECLLQLMSAIIHQNAASVTHLTPFVLFLSRQMFPVLHKWRYYDPHARERIGYKCLDIFEKLLNMRDVDTSPTADRIIMKDLVVQCLLYTEASRTLLDIVRTGVDTVEAGLASQGSAYEGIGTELIELVCLALSVLTQLLQRYPDGVTSSPVAQSLSAQPSGRIEHHLVATVAQYIYHRHSVQLPCLATALLTTLAQLFPMSMLACFGNEAEAIRDIYLARLQASTEDVELKIVILKWFATCVSSQPGVIEMFLNIISIQNEVSGTKELCADRISCLQTVLNLISEDRQGKYQCPIELLYSATSFIYSLWKGRQQIALMVLRQIKGFWKCLCLCLHVDLPSVSDESLHNSTRISTEIKTRANVYRILALELYHLNGSKLDEPLKQELKSLVDNERFLYWSRCLPSEMAEITDANGKVSDHPTLHFLLAWRDLLIMFAACKIDDVSFDSKAKDTYMDDLLTLIRTQFSSSNELKLRQKLASNGSATYFMVLKYWCSAIVELRVVNDTLEHICDVMRQISTDPEILASSVQVALLGAIVQLLQCVHKRQMSQTVDSIQLGRLLPIVCEIILSSTRGIDVSHFQTAVGDSKGLFDTRLKLPIVAVSALEQLIVTLGVDVSVAVWLPVINSHSIVQCLLSTVITLIQVKMGTELIQSVLMLFLTVSRCIEGAEALAVSRFNEQLCVPLRQLYMDSNTSQGCVKVKQNIKAVDDVTSSVIYKLYMCIMSSLLQSLKMSFVTNVISFIGVHQNRMHQCLDATGQLLNDEILSEAEETCHLLSCLSLYQREWRLSSPSSLELLMVDVCAVTQVCAGLLIRPGLLQHLLEKQTKEKSAQQPTPVLVMSLSRHLLQQSSLDDTDLCTPELLNMQHRLLNIIAHCLVSLRYFSPDLCDLLLCQNVDTSQFDAFVAIGFGVPSVDKQQNFPTFGTFVTIINLCLKLLPRVEGARCAVSPQKPQTPTKPFSCENSPIQRSAVMFVMENALLLIMSQAMRCLRDPSLSQRDKQLLKRELNAELNSFLTALQRYLRSASLLTPISPQFNRSIMKPAQVVSQFAQDQAFFRMVDIFVKQILK